MMGTNAASWVAMQNESNRRLADHEINELLKSYKESRKPEIRDRIVKQYSNLVESVARRFAGSAEPVEDLTQEGYIGLITAVEGYNASKGVKFSTYATHFIIGQIKHCLRDRGKIIKEPAWLQELNQRVSKVIESLSQELGRPPTHGEIASLTGMTEESVAELLNTREVFKVGSLDGGGDQDDDASGSYDMDRVKADRQVEFQLSIEDKVVMEAALARLKDLEQNVIREFFFKDRNQTEIARSLGISCNYVSHILRNSTKKLRKIMVTDDLREAQMELALLRKRTEETVNEGPDASVVDIQTRLYNASYFAGRMEEEISRCNRSAHPVGLVLIELQGSENISRAYGTIRGDDTVRHAAALLKSTIRRADVVTRLNETTFAVILPYAGEETYVVADRLSKVFADWLTEAGLTHGRAPVTLRVGCAYHPRDAKTAYEMTRKAMENLEAHHYQLALPVAA